MLYEDNTAKLLGLEDVFIKNVYEDESSYHIEVELPRRKHPCPCCGAETERIYDYRRQKIKDISAFGKNAYLYLRKRRYTCCVCGKRFYEKNRFLPRSAKNKAARSHRIVFFIYLSLLLLSICWVNCHCPLLKSDSAFFIPKKQSAARFY